MFKNNILIALLLAVTSVSSHATVYALSGTMDPIQATTNPSNTGSGIGTISGLYNDATKSLDYSISWSDLTSAVTNMHFHVGAVGVPGGVALGIPGPWSSPETGTGITLDATQETDLLAGNWYVNIHTTNFGFGEIRGQVNVAPVPEPSSYLLSMVSAAGFLAFRRRRHS
jgi:hypothetical protein